jgi:hypothetical protein
VNCYPFIEAENAGNHNVTRACELLKVSTTWTWWLSFTTGTALRAPR